MALNLDESTAHALEVTNALLAAADAARTQVAEMRERFGDLSEKIEAGWSLIRERGRVFLEQAVSEDQQLVSATTEASRALDVLRSTFERLDEEAPAEMESTQGEFDDLAETVGGVVPTLEAAMEETEAVEASLQAKVDEIQTEINDAIAQAEELLARALVSDLRELEAEAERETVELNAYFSGQCLPALAAKAQELYELLVQTEEDVRVAFTIAADEDESAAEQTLQETVGTFDEELDDLDRLGRDLEGVLGDLRAFIDRGLDRIKDRNSRWNDAVTTTRNDLKDTIDRLGSVAEYLQRFAFMK